MRILYISQYFPPEMGAPAARVFELSREWAALGHEVTVLTGFPNHPTGVTHPEYRGRILQQEQREGIHVVRTWLYAAANKGFGRRVLNYLSFPLSALVLGLPKAGHFDVVIATSPQFFVAVAGLVASSWLRCPFIFEVRDLWPDSIEAVGAIRNRHILQALRGIEAYLYRRATRIVAVTQTTPHILAKRGVDPGKVDVIPNGVDLDLFRPGSTDNAARRQLPRESRTVVSYIGTHGMAHALGTVLAAAEQLRERSDVHFVFVGEGAEKAGLEIRARERQLANVTFLPQYPREALPELYRASDVCLVPLRRVELFRSVLPSKMFEIMASGRPIILGVEGEARELLVKAQAGIAVTPECPGALVNAVVRLADNPSLREEHGTCGRRFVESHFSRTVLARRYLDLITRTRGGNDRQS